MNDETRPFWNEPANQTVAYQLPAKLSWQQKIENVIERIRDTYDALWDWMPAIAAFATLIWLINTFHR